MPLLKGIERCQLFVAALAVTAVIACPMTCKAQPLAGEYDVKAAFIYNFAKFIEWPDGAFNDSQSPISLCVFGKSNVEQAFDTVNGKQARGRKLIVRSGDEIDDLKSCKIIYISSSDKWRIASVLESVRGASVLTVGETSDFMQYGGMINFTYRGNKIRFEINPQAARRARLSISSQLLKLAEISGER